jgi:hypothetical protein
MGIWIRSQDYFTLKLCTNLFIVNGGIDGSLIKSDTSILGRYEDEEQAIFALDSIQEHYSHCINSVFEMPSIEEAQTGIAELNIYVTQDH